LLAPEEDDTTSPQLLRDMLLKLLSHDRAVPPTPKALIEQKSAASHEFIKPLLAAHLMSVRFSLKELGTASELVAKISVSLCRYCAEFPVDKAFHEAGLDCKAASMINMAFFFLNRFLDIADAIEDPDNAAIDNTDFLDTDIPSPYDLDMPEECHLSGTQIEEIRDWVLGWSMDQSVQQSVDKRPCDKCRTDIYAAALVCPNDKCKHQYEPCAVTGYPVVKKTRIECSSCHAACNREDWNNWVQVFKACPWCATPQNAQY